MYCCIKKKKKKKLIGNCNKITEWVEWQKIPMKEWTLSKKDIVKKIIKKFH